MGSGLLTMLCRVSMSYIVADGLHEGIILQRHKTRVETAGRGLWLREFVNLLGESVRTGVKQDLCDS